MSCKVMYTCDHCGKEVSPYLGKQWRVTLFTVGPNMDDVHACSKEHLGIALAKTFDIPVDASTLRLVTEKNDALNAARAAILERDDARSNREATQKKLESAETLWHQEAKEKLALKIERDNAYARIAELEARMPANECTNAERAQYETTIELQRKRIEELEKRFAELTAPMTVDGKTPGMVFVAAYETEKHRRGGATPASFDQYDQHLQETVECGAQAVLRAFGQPSQTATNAADALRRVRERINSDPYPDVRSLRHIDEELAKLEAKPAQCPPDTSTESGLPDPVIAAITLPTKPTKPLRERLNSLLLRWAAEAKNQEDHSDECRETIADCAAELQSTMDGVDWS